MSSPISPISAPLPVESISLGQTNSSGGDFKSVLESAVQQVESSRASADAAIKGFLNGENQELHSTILATQTAELQFEMFMQVRNKVTSAYEEIMRMQV
jgi:flagellar hook-basal body complex protein FliE